MSSLKCKQCGLVNFSHATECKRCLNPLGNIHAQRARFQNFQMPPPPPQFYENSAVRNDFEAQQKTPCIKCGNSQNISVRNFKKIYNSPVALLGIFLGILPYLILALLLRTTHYLSAPFCEDCWSKYKNADTLQSLYAVGAVAIIIAAIFAAIVYNSLWLMLIGFAAAIALYIYGKTYIKKVSPKFTKVDAKKVIIDAPLVGEILFTK